MQPSPLFARAYDLARETLKVVEGFPRHRRAVLGRQLEESVFALHGAVTEAARAARKGGAGPAEARKALAAADGGNRPIPGAWTDEWCSAHAQRVTVVG